MNTEVYIENQQADITKDIPALLNLAIDDIAEFGERSTTWSKTIVLPGTKRNNQILGHVFEIGRENEYNELVANYGYNFNPSKSATCYVFQDNIQAFKGVMRLLQINIDKNSVEYEVSIFGTLFSLNVALTGALLEDLDFSTYDDVFDETTVVASWDNTPGSGVYYPLIDHGTYSTNKHDWDIRTFRPALYIKEYIDKIFANAGFRFECDLFDTDRFKRLIVPYNRKKLQGLGANLVTGTLSATNDIVEDAEIIVSDFSATDFILVSSRNVEYTGANPINIAIKATITGTYTSSDGIEFSVLKRPTPSTLQTVALPAAATPTPFSVSFDVNSVFINGDYFLIEVFDLVSGGSFINDVTGSLLVENQAGTTVININPGDTTQLNNEIPKNIRQIDFLVSIVRLFNLYVYEDKFDDRLIYFKPYVDFYDYDSANSIDWTYKLNRDKRRTITPMSEINAKIYKFIYKEDNDYYNELYKKRYGQLYGSYIYDTDFEFASESQSVELIFAPTTLVGYEGEDKIYSTIFKRTGSDADPVEENIDSVIRILQTKKITGVTSWDILDGETVLDSVTSYGYAGHFDTPDEPNNDLNFGAPSELFYELTTGALSVNQFNVYWSPYMAEISDKDSKLLKGYFYLKPKDIFDLDFSRYITIDGVLFRLNKISDYDLSSPKDCEVELLKVINTTYS